MFLQNPLFKKRFLKSLKKPFLWILIMIFVCIEIYCLYSLYIHGVRIQVIFLSLLGLFFLILAFFWSFFRIISPDHVVIWLRRFHKHERFRFPMQKSLLLSGFMLFKVATIQDTKFKWSYLTGAMNSYFMFMIVQVILTFPSFLFSGYIVHHYIGLNDAATKGAFSYQFITTILLFPFLQALVSVPIFLFSARKRGVQKVSSEPRDINKIIKWIDSTNNGSISFLNGLKIFKCTDDIWNRVVNLLIDKSDAVIIDVSELNENMQWELRQCVQEPHIQKTILAYAVEPSKFPDCPNDTLMKEVEKLIGIECLKRVKFLSYPEPLPLKKGRPYMDIELQTKVDLYFMEFMNETFGENVWD